MEIRSEYEKICPMTTCSDDELLGFLHKQRVSVLNGNKDSSIEIIKVESIDKYISENNCKYAEVVINEFRGKMAYAKNN